MHYDIKQLSKVGGLYLANKLNQENQIKTVFKNSFESNWSEIELEKKENYQVNVCLKFLKTFIYLEISDFYFSTFIELI